jgi:hypothetical protein
MSILFFQKCFQLFVARIIDANNVPDKPLVLIDTFLMPGYIENDRWYGSLWDSLSKEQKVETFFVPTVVLTPLKDMLSLYRKARLSTRNYIFKESYLTLEDIFFAFRHKKRIKSINFETVRVLGYDFSNLIHEELNNNSDMFTVIESILTYRFIDQLRKTSVNVRLAIDWFEGQALDKAWNKGFKDFFPQTETIGYRATEGFPFYLCAYPISIEREADVIPNIMAVQGKGTSQTIREFLPDLDVILIPSFKSQYVWECENNRLNQSKYTVLIALPISVHYSIKIIKRVLDACNAISIKTDTIKFVIKPHPAQSFSEIKKNLPKLPKGMSFSKEKSFVKLIYLANLLITEASSTCLEAMACGVPVIMMENEGGLTYDPIPSRIPKNLYRKVRSQDQLTNTLNYYINLTPEDIRQQQIASKAVREDYFERITHDGINRFMNLDTNKRKSNG